jgi:hypothetical protein
MAVGKSTGIYESFTLYLLLLFTVRLFISLLSILFLSACSLFFWLFSLRA